MVKVEIANALVTCTQFIDFECRRVEDLKGLKAEVGLEKHQH